MAAAGSFLLLGVLFLIELAALASFAYWGFRYGHGLAAKLLLGIGAPLLAAVFWGLFVAPKSTVPVSEFLRLLLQLFVFALAALALYKAGSGRLAATYIAAAAAVAIGVYVLKL